MAQHDSSQQAVRLIFEYDGDVVRLVSQQPVDMVVPSFAPTERQQPGVYVDARDAGGATLASVPAPNAFGGSLEVFPEQPGEPIVRVDVARPRGAFTVVVPASDAASQVALVRVAAAGPAPQALADATTGVAGAPEATDIATFPLEVHR
jgi:hypothetical protein